MCKTTSNNEYESKYNEYKLKFLEYITQSSLDNSKNKYKLIFFKRAIQSLLDNNKLEIEHSILNEVNYLFISLDWINIYRSKFR